MGREKWSVGRAEAASLKPLIVSQPPHPRADHAEAQPPKPPAGSVPTGGLGEGLLPRAGVWGSSSLASLHPRPNLPEDAVS